MKWGSYDKAEQLLKKAFTISRKRHGWKHSDTIGACQQLIQFYMYRSEYKKAEPWVNRLCTNEKKARQEQLSLKTIDIATHIYTCLSRYEKAEELYQMALQKPMKQYLVNSATRDLHTASKEIPLKDTYKKYIYYGKLANLYLKRGNTGDIDKAQKLLKDVISTYDTDEKIRQKIPSIERANAYSDLALAYQRQGSKMYKEAERFYNKALEILGEDNEIETAHVHQNLGQFYRAQSDFSKAEEKLKQARRVFSDKLGEDHLTVAETNLELNLLYLKQGRYDKINKTLDKISEICEKKLGSDHSTMARIQNSLGWLYQELGRYAEAESWVQQSYELTKTQFGADHSYTATRLRNLGKLHMLQGKYQEAWDELEKSRTILEREPEEKNYILALSLIDLGRLSQKQGRYEEAKNYLEKALTIREERDKASGTIGHSVTLQCKNRLASVYIDLEEFDKAENCLQEVFNQWEKLLGSSSENQTFQQYLADTLINFGRLHQKQDDHDNAEKFFLRAKDTLTKLLDPEHPDIARIYSYKGEICQRLGENNQAEQWYQRALNIQKKKLGDDHPDTVKSRNLLDSLSS